MHITWKFRNGYAVPAQTIQAKAGEEAAAQRALNKRATTVAETHHVTLKFNVPPPQPKIDPYNGMSETGAKALKDEDF